MPRSSMGERIARSTTEWQATTFACADWNNGSAGTYACGFENSSTNGWINGGTLACNASRPVLCVDQPPATLPATH